MLINGNLCTKCVIWMGNYNIDVMLLYVFCFAGACMLYAKT